MKRVATAIVLIPLVLILILRGPLPLLTVATAAVALLGVRELLALAEHYSIQPLFLSTYVFVILIFSSIAILLTATTQIEGMGAALLTLLATVTASIFVLLALGMHRPRLSTAFPAAAASLVALLYVVVPLALLMIVRELWAGGFLLLYLLLVVWAGDTFAYYTGRAIGRHKLAPRVSPGKTWEGSVASFAGSMLVGWAVFAHAPQISSALYSARLLSSRHAMDTWPRNLPAQLKFLCSRPPSTSLHRWVIWWNP
jgi:phosphatidate cytidylyltransferase